MKLWQVLVLIVVGALTAAGGYFGYNYFLGSAKAEETPNRQVVQVTRGTLETTVSTVGSLTMPNQSKLGFAAGGTVTEVNVKVGDKIEKGEVLAKLDTSSLERAVEQARITLNTAEINLEEVRNPYTAADIADAEASVRDAQVSLDNARRNLQITQQGLTTSGGATTSRKITDLENEVNWYEANYGQALVDYQEGKIDEAKLGGAWNNLVTAKQKLEEAKLQLENSIATALNNVAKAEDSLRKAEENLANKKAGPDPNTVKIKENDVANKQVALEEALEQLQGATILAPFSGVVASVGAKAGEKVTTATAVVTLIDPNVIEVQGTVDEIDVAQVKAGQGVTITLDALSGVSLQGTVATVAPTATSASAQSGVVNYAVSISVTNPSQDVGLKAGMTASAAITVQRKENVLLVPTRAVRRTGGRQVVEVMVDGQTELRVVAVGMSDGQQTEITSGLEEGEAVVVQMTTSTTTTTTTGPQRQIGIGPGMGEIFIGR